MAFHPPDRATTERLKPAVVIATTLDTKSAETRLLTDALGSQGLDTILIDCGILGEPKLRPDIDAREVAALAGADIDDLRRNRDRAAALQTMMRGLSACIERLYEQKLVRGFLAMGGGTNTALASAAFEQLPFGVPKLLVATTVSGDTSRIVGPKDVVLIHSVIDILGVGSYLQDLLHRAAAVMGALIREAESVPTRASAPCVGITAFGSTTPAANAAFDLLSAAGNEVLTFHARGSGGRAAEAFMRNGRIQLMLDLTTTEIADEVVGGTMSAGPTRMDAAVEMGLPQVLLPGAVDMVNFGPRETIPGKFADRLFLQHTPMTTLMRTSAEELARIARYMAGKLERATAPTIFVIPMRGFSAYDAPDAPFFDPEADAAFVQALESSLRSDIPILKIDAHINDPAVAELAVRNLLQSASVSI